MINLKIIKFINKSKLKVQTYELRTTNTRRYCLNLTKSLTIIKNQLIPEFL